jgi:hypothetical protein
MLLSEHGHILLRLLTAGASQGHPAKVSGTTTVETETPTAEGHHVQQAAR